MPRPCLPAPTAALLAAALFGLGWGGAQASAQEPEPGSQLRVWLVTAQPGDAVWERFGHNAIRILDTGTGRDVSYNWGIFSFDQPGFVARFLKGEMLYMMAGYWTGPTVEAYTGAGRDVVLQELALTPAQRARLLTFLEWNALPENRDYRYDYFRDNCSTRVRDALDQVLEGALGARFREADTGTSYRWHNRRLTRMDPLLFTGMDVLLGSPGDRPITVWEEMFLPMTLRDAVRDFTVQDEDGVSVPLVLDEVRVGPGTRPADALQPPRWLAWYAVLGAFLGGLLAWSGTAASGALATRGRGWARAAFAVVAVAWSLTVGLVGTLLVLVLFTDHVFMTWNANLLVASPVSLVLAGILPGALRRAWRTPAGVPGPWPGRAAAAALALACVAVVLAIAARALPVTGQDTAVFLALSLPAHVGLWWGLRAAGASPTPAGVA